MLNTTGPKQPEFHPEHSKLPETALRANQIGVSFFFTGKRCVRNHLAPKYASSGNCTECIIEKRNLTPLNMRSGKKIRSEEQLSLAMIALQNGYSTYFGRPCPKNHNIRWASNGNCVECNAHTAKKRKEYTKWKRVEKIYGLSKSQVEEMISNQNNTCLICETNFNEKNMHIDHCHKTNKVRALLCSKCNQAIGLLDEDDGRFERAAKYLKGFASAAS